MVGGGGHGSNSYAVGYYLVLGRVRLLLHLAVGGAYSNTANASRRVMAVFAHLARVMPTIEARACRAPVVTLGHADYYPGGGVDRRPRARDHARAVERLVAS